MTGTRLPDGFEPTREQLAALGLEHTPRGAYWRDSAGEWAVCTPNGRHGSICKHTVVEHDDKTITVSPSILVYPVDGAGYDGPTRARMVESYGEEQVQAWERGRPSWHGFLERGIWREC